LCLPGEGEIEYDKMGQALVKVLYGQLILHHVDRLGNLDQLLLNANNKILPNVCHGVRFIMYDERKI
jgi:hypothetical protein